MTILAPSRDTLTCRVCGQALSVDAFHRHRGMRDGRRGVCSQCDQHRNRRKRSVGHRVIDCRHMPKCELEAGRREYPEPILQPTTRGDCMCVPRPCPYVACKHNTYLDVKPNGNIVLNFPDIGPEAMTAPNCVLDLVQGGEQYTLEQVAAVLNLTRERARQIEFGALRKIRNNPETPLQFREWIEE